jgi:hypothetical protein
VAVAKNISGLCFDVEILGLDLDCRDVAGIALQVAEVGLHEVGNLQAILQLFLHFSNHFSLPLREAFSLAHKYLEQRVNTFQRQNASVFTLNVSG